MNVPEALRATEQAVNMFSKVVAEARDQLDSEMHRIHSQLLEEQSVAVDSTREEYTLKRA